MGLAKLTGDLIKKYKVEAQDMKTEKAYERISSGSFIVDYLSGGGFAKGKINEIYGPPGAGKTSLALSTVAWVQKSLKKAVVYIDAEHSLNEEYVTSMQIDTDPNMFVSFQENSAEKVRNILKELLEKAEELNLGLIVIDSAAAVIPEGWKEIDNDGPQVGERARFWSQFVPYLSSEVDKTGVTLLYVNQIRSRIDVNATRYTPEEDKETTIGGKAVEYFKVLSFRLRGSKKINLDKEYVDPETGLVGPKADGLVVHVKTIKNKTGGTPFLQGHFSLKFGKGIDNVADMIPIFLHKGIIQKVDKEGDAKDTGLYYQFKDLQGEVFKVKGEESLAKELEKRPKLCDSWVKEMGYSFNYFAK